MPDKELKKQITGKSSFSTVFLTLKLLFDLIPQVLLVVLISALFENNADKKSLLMVFAGIFGCYVIKHIFGYYSVKASHDNAYSRLTQVRLDLIKHLKQLNLAFFHEHTTGELTNIIRHDVDEIEVYLAHGKPETMAVTILPVLSFIAMAVIDWRLALAMLAGLPLMYLVKVLSQKTINRNFAIYFGHESKMQSEMMEYVKNIAVIKAFAKEEVISDQTLKTASEYVYWVKKSMASITVPMGLTDVFMESGSVFVMILGSIFLYKGYITVPAFLLAVILSNVFTASISKTATLQHFSVVFNEAVKSIGTILNEPKEKAKKSDGLTSGDIELKNVSFEYDQDSFRLENIDLTIKRNSVNSIVGASGCGKSTLANLIMGYWKPDEGTILMDGKNLNEYKQDYIAEFIGNVSQETILFDRSIRENIAIGKNDATDKEIEEAAKKAKCHDFIMTFPSGYETRPGEMGLKLSGGEKQRIAIARMILKNAPVLILDEAMAAVDSENERLIVRSLDELRKDKTVITIAHHLNTVTDSDQIIVMDKGRIIDKGRHKELLERCSLYKEMVEAQNKVDMWDVREEPAYV